MAVIPCFTNQITATTFTKEVGGYMEGRVEIIIKGEGVDKKKALYGLLKGLTDLEIKDVFNQLANSYITRFARLIHGELYKRLLSK